MNVRLFLIGVAALLVAVNAAVFSVTGLSMLFAGASLSVMIMAGSLEFAKLVAASFLYFYWNKLGGLIKAYITSAILILIFITSLGIYGFLTAAYQTTSDELALMDRRIETIELRKSLFSNQLELARNEQDLINQTIRDLSGGLTSGTTVQFIDQESGQLVTTTSAAARRTLETQLNNAVTQRDLLSNRVIALSDSVASMDVNIIDIRTGTEVAGEIGPLRFISNVSGLDMDTVVNLLALLIVFVFDPLAVTLVIAFNMGLKINAEDKIQKSLEKKELKIYGDTPTQIVNNTDTVKPPTPVDAPNVSPSGDEISAETIDDTPTISVDEPEILPSPTEPYENIIGTIQSGSLVMTKDDIEELINSKGNTTSSKKIPVDIDGDGIIDGYDTNGDGLIDIFEPKSSARWRQQAGKKPYYAREGFDWSSADNWKDDVNAVNYYKTFIRNKNNYPTDFNSKTY
jgi:hypothetical protein